MLQRIGFSPNPLLGDGIARWAEELQRHYPNANIGDTKSAQNGDPDFDDPDEEKFAEPAVDSVVEEGRRVSFGVGRGGEGQLGNVEERRWYAGSFRHSRSLSARGATVRRQKGAPDIST